MNFKEKVFNHGSVKLLYKKAQTLNSEQLKIVKGQKILT